MAQGQGPAEQLVSGSNMSSVAHYRGQVVQAHDRVERARGDLVTDRQGAPVKILGRGEIKKALKISAHGVSQGAREKIEAAGGKVVGEVPQGLPGVTIPDFDMPLVLKMATAAITIALIGFMEAIAIAKAMAAKTGQRLDPNQELVGQGLANICGSMAKSYPTSGSFSRSAVNLQSGALTGFSSLFTSLAVVVVLLFFSWVQEKKEKLAEQLAETEGGLS